MFSSGPNYTKLKTNLRLAITRLKLLEKKKSELTEKSRREIADYISAGKFERAKIRVEYIIREDYLVEALEIVEMYCDLLVARFGLIQNMKELDEGIAEAISSIIWVAPRLMSDIQEIKVIADLLAAKYGLPYAEACRIESVETISPKLKHKLSIQSPPKILVEKYVIEIAKVFNIPYDPDPQIMAMEKGNDALLIDLSDHNKNNLGGGGMPQPPGFVGYPQPPALPMFPEPPGAFAYPPPHQEKAGGPSAPPPSFSYNIPPMNDETKESNTDYMDNLPTYSMVFPDVNKGPGSGEGSPKDDNTSEGHGSGETSPKSVNASEGHGSGETSPKGDNTSEGHGSGENSPKDDNTLEGHGSGETSPKDDNTSENTDDKPKPLPRTKMNNEFNLPDLPSVPNMPPPGPSNTNKDDEIDFDDLTRRFNELKKKF